MLLGNLIQSWFSHKGNYLDNKSKKCCVSVVDSRFSETVFYVCSSMFTDQKDLGFISGLAFLA